MTDDGTANVSIYERFVARHRFCIPASEIRNSINRQLSRGIPLTRRQQVDMDSGQIRGACEHTDDPVCGMECSYEMWANDYKGVRTKYAPRSVGRPRKADQIPIDEFIANTVKIHEDVASGKLPPSTLEADKPRRGRPPGSKNKPKADVATIVRKGKKITGDDIKALFDR